MRKAIGLGYPFDVTWVEDIYSLKKLYVEAGLEVEKSWLTRSHLPERSYEADEAGKVFEENIHRDPSFAGNGKLELARQSLAQDMEKRDAKGR